MTTKTHTFVLLVTFVFHSGTALNLSADPLDVKFLTLSRRTTSENPLNAS